MFKKCIKNNHRALSKNIYGVVCEPKCTAAINVNLKYYYPTEISGWAICATCYKQSVQTWCAKWLEWYECTLGAYETPKNLPEYVKLCNRLLYYKHQLYMFL